MIDSRIALLALGFAAGCGLRGGTAAPDVAATTSCRLAGPAQGE